jgi:S-adenosylmethionine uptake transporter
MPAMPAPLLMVLASLLFATMGVTVKMASAQYGPGEIVFYRAAVGFVFIFTLTRFNGVSLRTRLPAMHFWRSLSGVVSLSLWFYALAHLPLATAVTLNYMSSVWMALFLIGGAVMVGGRETRIDGRLVGTVLLGFVGVALVLRPSLGPDQLWAGLLGLLSGMLSALAYLQITALGRAGEPEQRVVFYFCVGGMAAGGIMMAVGGHSPHTLRGVALLLATGLLATTAQVMMTRAYAIGRPLSNASLQYLGIAFSFGFGVWLFNDPVTASALGGMLLIVGAGLAATFLRAGRTPADSTLSPPES